ncbi:MAG: GNAT family N-acetyltransferase [Rhodospirillales bacterium]
MYPFLKCPIDDSDHAREGHGLSDVQSAYGYGGPVVNGAGEDTGFLGDAWRRFAGWCAEAGVVAEFCRFHPLLDNHRWAAAETRLRDDRETVVIDLETYPAAVWDDPFFRRHRNMVRKSEREGYTFQVLSTVTPEHVSWFAPMYAETQDAMEAGAETRFGAAYFETLVDGLGGKAWIGVVDKGAQTEAAVLVIEGARFAHCHLMGYGGGGPRSGLSNCLFHGTALESARRGLRLLHVGGGKTGDGEDPLFRFKTGLSPERRMFRIGTRCHDRALYDELGALWERRNGPRPEDYFLFYRL